MCVRLSVCPRGCLRNHTRDLYQICCACCVYPTGRGSVLLQQGDEIPRGRDSFGVFFPIDNVLYSTAFGNHTKTTETSEMPFEMMSGLGPRNSVLRGSHDARRGRGNFGVGTHVPDKPNTRVNCELDWSMQCAACTR